MYVPSLKKLISPFAGPRAETSVTCKVNTPFFLKEIFPYFFLFLNVLELTRIYSILILTACLSVFQLSVAIHVLVVWKAQLNILLDVMKICLIRNLNVFVCSPAAVNCCPNKVVSENKYRNWLKATWRQTYIDEELP